MDGNDDDDDDDQQENASLTTTTMNETHHFLVFKVFSFLFLHAACRMCALRCWGEKHSVINWNAHSRRRRRRLFLEWWQNVVAGRRH